MTRLDTFDADAQAQPPDGQLAQVEQSMCGREGHTVVAANVGGQATLLEKPLKCCESVVFASGRESFACEEKAAGVVSDGQRVAVMLVAQQELAFVVGAPELIGPLAWR